MVKERVNNINRAESIFAAIKKKVDKIRFQTVDRNLLRKTLQLTKTELHLFTSKK